MEAPPTARKRLSFGVFEADLSSREIYKRGRRVHLQDQPFRILSLLLERSGELVTREEIRQNLWPDGTFVDFGEGIDTALKKLRHALGDSADNPIFIETVPRRGYRFIGSLHVTNGVSPAEESIRTAAAPAMPRPRYQGVALIAASLLLAGIAVFGLDIGGLRSRLLLKLYPPAIHSLAVLPLENLSNDPNQEYFSDGMTDALTTDLSQISALKVISRTSAMRYKKTDKSLPQIGRELGVDAVVEGTVQRSGDRVRITAQLIEAATDKHIWARSYERHIEDLLSLQGDIARTIAQEISVEVKPQEKLRMTRTRPINLKAVDAYLQGQYHYQKAKDMTFHFGKEVMHEAELNQAIAFFQRAVIEDPNYAPAYIGMGEVWGVPATFPYPPTSMVHPAREALRKALAIDPDLAKAYVDLAIIDFRDWNWSAPEQEVKHAIELEPNLAAAHVFYTNFLLALDRMDEAMAEAERVKALDPADDRVAWVFYCERRFDRFIELKRSDLARHAFGPVAHYHLGYGYERAHMYKEAVDEWEKAMTGFGYDDLARDLRRGYTKGGFRSAVREWAEGWERIARQGGTVLPDLPAYLFGILGERDRAFAWLEKSMEMHTGQPLYFKIDPTLDDLRSDPRFADLIRRVGLPQ